MRPEGPRAFHALRGTAFVLSMPRPDEALKIAGGFRHFFSDSRTIGQPPLMRFDTQGPEGRLPPRQGPARGCCCPCDQGRAALRGCRRRAAPAGVRAMGSRTAPYGHPRHGLPCDPPRASTPRTVARFPTSASDAGCHATLRGRQCRGPPCDLLRASAPRAMRSPSWASAQRTGRSPPQMRMHMTEYLYKGIHVTGLQIKIGGQSEKQS